VAAPFEGVVMTAPRPIGAGDDPRALAALLADLERQRAAAEREYRLLLDRAGQRPLTAAEARWLDVIAGLCDRLDDEIGVAARDIGDARVRDDAARWDRDHSFARLPEMLR
jgi:hypothetical protein